MREEFASQGWSGDRIRAAVEELYRGGAAEMIRTNDRESFTTLWRGVLGSGISLPPASLLKEYFPTVPGRIAGDALRRTTERPRKPHADTLPPA